jgi:hypothetical protein
MKTVTLAAAIQRDLLRAEPAKTNAPACFACGRSFMPRPSTGDDNTHAFCSAGCREYYDAGGPPFDPSYASKTNPRWYSLPMGRHGFVIRCFGCDKDFDSKGLRCCSIECERDYLRRRENEQTMAAVDMERPVKRKCEACGGNIPNWRKGRRVSSATKFCSSCPCARRAKKAGMSLTSPGAESVIQTAKKAA